MNKFFTFGQSVETTNSNFIFLNFFLKIFLNLFNCIILISVNPYLKLSKVFVFLSFILLLPFLIGIKTLNVFF